MEHLGTTCGTARALHLPSRADPTTCCGGPRPPAVVVPHSDRWHRDSQRVGPTTLPGCGTCHRLHGPRRLARRVAVDQRSAIARVETRRGDRCDDGLDPPEVRFLRHLILDIHLWCGNHDLILVKRVNTGNDHARSEQGSLHWIVGSLVDHQIFDVAR